MSNSLYRKALEDLNNVTYGCDNFEDICHILIRKIKPDFHFISPSGGNGRKDGGRDGYDNEHNFRMACSIEKDVEKKINVEFAKIQKKDKGLIYFTNQVIPETKKIEYEKQCNIELEIVSIDDIVKYIKLVDSKFDINEIDRLLGFSFQSFEFLCNTYGIRKISKETSEIYKSKIIIASNNDSIISSNPLYEYLLRQLNNKWETINNIFLSGTSGIGKTFLMQDAYNKIFDLTDQLVLEKPVPIYIDFRYCTNLEIPEIQEIRKKKICFFDGLDCLSEKNKILIRNQIHTLIEKDENIRMVISGRSGAFIPELSVLEKYKVENLIMVKYFDSTNQNMKMLKAKYEDTPICDLYLIPKYAKFLLKNGKDDYFSIKTFFNDYIITEINNDKKIFDEARYISVNEQAKSSIKVNSEFINRLENVAFNNFINNYSIDSLIDQYFTEEEKIFLKQSSIFDFFQIFRFSSSFYYYYLISAYLLKQKEKYIFNFFFVGKKYPQIKYTRLEILQTYILMLDSESKIYAKIIENLKRIDPTYIFLLDTNLISAEIKYKAYLEILESYNLNKKLIYYSRFQESYDLLKKISSLAGKMIDLVPLSYSDAIFNKHLDTIKNFLHTPDDSKVSVFSNSIILLGVYQEPIWTIEQQKELKRISISLLQFFLNNPIAITLKGLLSESIILNWYSTYDWTNSWDSTDWNTWIKKIDLSFNDIEKEINSYKEFSFKLKIFNEFNSSPLIYRMFDKIILYLLNSKFSEDEYEDSILPKELDDDYKTPVLQFSNDLFILKYYIENNDFDIEPLVNICLYIAKNKIHLYQINNYQLNEIINAVFKKLEETISISIVSSTQINNIYQFIFSYENSLTDVNIVNKLPDYMKKDIFNLAINDVQKDKLSYSYYHCNIYVELLNIKKEEDISELIKSIQRKRTVKGIFIDIILTIKNRSEHNGYSIANSIYSSSTVFRKYRITEKNHQLKISKFENDKARMFNNEATIVADFKLIKQEIQNVFNFIDTNKELKYCENDKDKLIKLRIEHIEQMIKYDFQDQYSPLDIFSDFIVSLLFEFSFNDTNTINRSNLFQIISDWESDSKYYWRFFYYFYVQHKDFESVKSFVNKNSNLKNKIITSFETEFPDWLEHRTVEDFDKRNVHTFIKPFIYYIELLYDNSCPDILLHNKKEKLCFISCWDFSKGQSFRTSNDFTAGKFENVYDWVIDIFKLSKDEILEILKMNYDSLSNDFLKSQCLSYMLKNIDNPKYNSWIMETLFDLSIKESSKKYSSYEKITWENNVLSQYWRENQSNNFIEKVGNLFSLDWVNKEYNYCQKEMQNYYLSYATDKDKNKVIKKLKTGKEQNITQLLAMLGDENATIKILDGYLEGVNLPSEYWMGINYKPIKKSKKLIKKYVQLFDYSQQKNSDRRTTLYSTAQNGIRNNISKKNYPYFKRLFEKIIKKQNISSFVDYLKNFENEIYQMVYGTDKQLREKMINGKQKLFIILFVIGLSGIVYSYIRDLYIAKIITWIFTVFAGLCSILPFMGMNNMKVFMLKIRNKLLRKK